MKVSQGAGWRQGSGFRIAAQSEFLEGIQSALFIEAPYRVARESHDSKFTGAGDPSLRLKNASARDDAAAEAAGGLRESALDFAAFASGVDVDQGEGCSFTCIAGLDGYDVLIIFCADFQFGYGAGILLARQLSVLAAFALAIFALAVF